MTQIASELSTQTTCDASVYACPPVTTASIQTSMAIDYDLPIDPVSINNLCSCAATASSDTALGAVWRHAFKMGQDNASQMVDGMQVSNVLKIGFKKGQVHRIVQECELWEMAGHSQTCFTTASSLTATADTGTQVDLVTPLPPCTNTLVQTISADIQTSSTQTSPPPLVNVDMQTSVTMEPSPPLSHLDWAEDATSLPILPLLPISSVPCQCIPRDFLGLGSSQPNLFGSLQCHSNTQIAPRHHQKIPFAQPLPSRYRPPLCPLSSLPKPQIFPQALKNALSGSNYVWSEVHFIPYPSPHTYLLQTPFLPFITFQPDHYTRYSDPQDVWTLSG